MKKKFASSLMIFSSLICLSPIAAQMSAANLLSSNQNLISKSTEILSANTNDLLTALPEKQITIKVIRSFYEAFKNTSAPRWFNQSKNFVAYFEMNGMACHAFFEKTGYLRYTVSRGTEKDLPAVTRKLVKSFYVDYEIGIVNKVNTQGVIAWIINLSSDDEIVTARVMENSIDELAKYRTPTVAPKSK